MCDSCSVTTSAVELPGGVAQGAGVHPFGESICDHPGERLGGGVHARERGLVVEVAVGELGQHCVQLLGRATDVDHDVVGVEGRAPERGVDDVRRAVQALRGPEHLAAEAVGDHHVIAYGHAEHVLFPVVGDGVAERRQAPGGQPGHHVGQLAEAGLPGDERVEGGVAQQLERECQPVGRRAAPAAGRGERSRPGWRGCRGDPSGTRRPATAGPRCRRTS